MKLNRGVSKKLVRYILRKEKKR